MNRAEKVMEKGSLFVVSAPSGAGKSTLLNLARKSLPSLAVTVSATTRAPRLGEVDGADYYFVTRQAFEESLQKGAFAEWAEVHGHLYGTYKSEIERHIHAGVTIVLELDVQGMRSIKALYPEMISVFIAPPSLRELERRLVARGANDPADMQVRLENARKEMEARDEFDHTVVNDDLERAAAELTAILGATGPSRTGPVGKFN